MAWCSVDRSTKCTTAMWRRVRSGKAITGCKCWESLQALESVEENRETRGQDLTRAQTSTRRDPPHHCAIAGLEVSPILLCTRLTSEAVALSLSHVEPHLRYGKLATSNTPTRTADAAV